jgi:hypothetical protein
MAKQFIYWWIEQLHIFKISYWENNNVVGEERHWLMKENVFEMYNKER